MKRTIRLSLLLIALVMGSTIFAQSNMHVITSMGWDTYAINDVQTLTFTSSDMNVNDINGSTPFAMNDITKLVFNNTVGVNEVEQLSNVSIFPNPSTGMVNLMITDGSSTEYTLKIYNVIGTLLKSVRYTNNGSIETQIDLSNYLNGMYIMQIEGRNNQITKRIIIQK